ncbi:hypothetical protein CLV62_14626 [Dysgonomonas alginatilytica]|uniref:DUF4190 domain-containing protein n=1 Tax=Dysgonomonas alginatilytica TaxID=1605892 RepID=A0A2V3PJL6_9BACT|nr:hypothetical protein [Dysgonomonas alginatilytica]PXV58475.1 hypothetical protein CLV62_14626 [Dysgonomonas alginatilytica]
MSDGQVREGQTGPNQTFYIQQQEARQTNGIGTAGFVLALIALFLSWIPFLSWLLWVLGLIFSIVGVFKQPRGLAIAGLVISLLCVILILLVAGAIATAIGFSM